MNESSINKVMLLGYVAKAPRKHGECWRFVLVTPERHKYTGGEKPHEEQHVVRVQDKPGLLLPETGQWLFIEGTIRTKMHLDAAGVRRYRTEVQVVQLTEVPISTIAATRVA